MRLLNITPLHHTTDFVLCDIILKWIHDKIRTQHFALDTTIIIVTCNLEQTLMRFDG